jgi:poly(3-hydroxybutyrate) depolymerase
MRRRLEAYKMSKIVLLLAAFALLVAGTASAAAGNHSDVEISYEVITFENEDGTVYGTFTTPADIHGKAPAVLMLHGFTGDRDEASLPAGLVVYRHDVLSDR